MIKLIVGLGNPGKTYEGTRHSVGFSFVDSIWPNARYQNKFHSLYTEEDGFKIIKPLTYMNLSGTAVSECASFFHFKADEILIIHDDLELAFGVVKIQKGGGLKGHNGLKNIKERIGRNDFWRVRIGIGRPIHGDVSLFVTAPFTQDENIVLSTLFPQIEREILKKDLKETEIR